MTDPHGPDGAELDRLLGALPVAPAPISQLVSVGRARRHRRRWVLGAAATGTAAVLVVGALVTQGVTDTDPAPGGPGAVTVDVREPAGGDPGAGTAQWNAERRELIYTSAEDWSSSCFAVGTADQKAGRIDLTLESGGTENADGEVVCTADAVPATAVVRGLDAEPAELRVTEGDRTRTVTIAQPGQGFDVRVDTDLSPADGQVQYEEGALTEVRIVSEQGEQDPFRPTAAPWQRSWLDLPPGRYSVRGLVRPCSGNCGYLDEPTDTCGQSLDLTEDTVVRVRFSYGEPCTIEVAADPDAAAVPREREVGLMTSDWRPGDFADEALGSGVVAVDPRGCVFLETRGIRTYVAWPADWTATFDLAQHVVLRDADGTVVVHDGDTISAGGGFGRFTGDLEACAGASRGGVFIVQSAVAVS